MCSFTARIKLLYNAHKHQMIAKSTLFGASKASFFVFFLPFPDFLYIFRLSFDKSAVHKRAAVFFFFDWVLPKG